MLRKMKLSLTFCLLFSHVVFSMILQQMQLLVEQYQSMVQASAVENLVIENQDLCMGEDFLKKVSLQVWSCYYCSLCSACFSCFSDVCEISCCLFHEMYIWMCNKAALFIDVKLVNCIIPLIRHCFLHVIHMVHTNIWLLCWKDVKTCFQGQHELTRIFACQEC